MATSDKDQKEQGKQVVFGLGQIGNPTPMMAKHLFRAYSFLAGLWALLAPQFTHITPETMGEINRYLLIGATVMHFSIKFFGWDYKEQ